ncbi:MAG: DUF1365 domain-containing protein [Alcanivorax jadensis]|uniref:DUF1365 domain-containing protein n=1 Tax=Alcanivorax jadensis TaxID=64988 RepID=UPI003000FD6A
MITQAIARGKVWHQRLVPFRHGFHYPLWMVWCDLTEVDAMLARHPAWGRRWRPVVFRDSDFVDARPDNLNDKVREKALELGLDWQAGRVVMLGQWRTLGTLFNPLVLYLHFSGDSDQPDSMLAEVQNTPWRERHFYPLNLQKNEQGDWVVSHPKAFHVSPFLPMALDYHWHLHVALPGLRLMLEDRKEDQVVFVAGLQLDLKDAGKGNMGSVIFRFGAQGVATMRAIYWQAFRLWRKGGRFHSHPGKNSNNRYGD